MRILEERKNYIIYYLPELIVQSIWLPRRQKPRRFLYGEIHINNKITMDMVELKNDYEKTLRKLQNKLLKQI